MAYRKIILTPLDWLVLAGCLIFSSWLMFHTLSYEAGQIIMASKLYSDFGAHLPLVRSFFLGVNWPPEYPTFPGEPIRYHFLFYFLAGFLEKSGLNFAWAVNLPSLIGFTLLLYLIYWCTKTIFARSSAGLLAIILFLFNGSLAFIEFFQKFPLNPRTLTQIITAQHFASFGPWSGRVVAAFWNLNIYTNQRHLAFSFGLLLLLLVPLINTLYRRYPTRLWFWLILSLVMLILPWFNQAALLCALPLIYIPLLINYRLTKPLFLPYVLISLASLPGLVYTASLGPHPVTLWYGYLTQIKTLENISIYWLFNLGLYFFLFPLLFFWTDKRGKSLLLAALSLFITANLFNLSPDIINNHKLINAFMLIVVIFTAGFLTTLWRLSNLFKPLVVILVLCLTFSGLVDFFPVLNDARGFQNDLPKIPAAVWIHAHTPKDAVFLTNVYLYHPAHYAGRKTYLDYGYFNWSMGYPDGERRQHLPQLFSPFISQPFLCSLLNQEGIDYIALHPGHGDLGTLDPHQSTIAREFQPDYTAPDGLTIYSVMGNCSP